MDSPAGNARPARRRFCDDIGQRESVPSSQGGLSLYRFRVIFRRVLSRSRALDEAASIARRSEPALSKDSLHARHRAASCRI